MEGKDEFIRYSISYAYYFLVWWFLTNPVSGI